MAASCRGFGIDTQGTYQKLANSPRLKRMKAGPGGLELEFDQKLDRAQKELDTAETSSPIDNPVISARTEEVDFIKEMARLAQVSPRSVVMESFTRLEGLLRRAVSDLTESSKTPNYLSVRTLVRQAVAQEILPRNEASVIDELAYLRNRVAHEPDEVISTEAALRYADLVAQVIDTVGGRAEIE